MKQILLMIAVVALVGCGEREDGNTGVVNPKKPSPKAASKKLITDPIVEKAIRKYLKYVKGVMPAGELTKADLDKLPILHLNGNKLTDVPKGLEKLTQLEVLNLYNNRLTEIPKELEKLTHLKQLDLNNNQLTDVKELEKLTWLRMLNLRHNPALTKAQIAELQKALPNCKIHSNPTK